MDTRRRVLIIDDVLPSAQLFKICIMKIRGVEPVVFTDPNEALRDAATHTPDCILLDYQMPGVDGLEVLRRLRGRPNTRDVPVILITGQDQPGLRVDALDQGANDFLTKPVDDLELRARVQTMLEKRGAVQALKGTRAQLAVAARHDSLTNTLNRAAFVAKLAEEIANARAEREGMGFALIDIEGLRVLNIEHGFLTGDALLRTVAERIPAALKDADVLGRWDGDTFAVVLTGQQREKLKHAAKRLRAAVAGQPVRLRAGPEVPVDVHIGITALRAADTVEKLVLRAERALNDCKKTPKLRVVTV